MHNHVHFRFGDIKTFLANLKKKKKMQITSGHLPVQS